MFVKERFALNDYTTKLLQNMEPAFGFDGFGEFVFYRTYSRIKLDGGQESWADCVTRVINGCFSIRKDWYLKNGISWDERWWQNYAKKMAISLFKMEWMPGGRSLWAGGTEFVFERGSMALNNCGFVEINDNFEKDLGWLMDALMLGVGVGYRPFRNDRMEWSIQSKEKYDFVIPDSREGWVESCERLIKAIRCGKPKPRMIYDEVREAGLPIKGFGGIASGPEPLMQLHEHIETFMDWYATDNYYDSVMLKSDIANTMGVCVISGNTRRCLPALCRVHTVEGLKKIKDISVGDQVQTLNGYKKVTNVFKQGKQKVLTIYTTNGRSFRCTPNHKLAVLNHIDGDYTWIEAQELQDNDTLFLNHQPCEGEDNLTVDEAYFYGLLNTDGNCHDRRKEGVGANTRIRCSSDELGETISDKLTDCIHRMGYKWKRKDPKKGNHHSIDINNTWLTIKLLPYKTPFSCPIIPPCIYSASIKARAAYLAGICDGDGTAPKYNLCSSVYLKFLKELQLIASSLGIDTWIGSRPQRIVAGKLQNAEHLLYVKGFASKKLACRLLHPHMIKRFPIRDHAKWDNNIPCGFVEHLTDKTLLHQLIAPSKSGGPVRNIIHKQLIDLYPDFWSKVTPTQVDMVLDHDEEYETYDIEVEDEHSFFAEGFLVHNSALLSSLSIKDPTFKDLKNYEDPKYAYRSSHGWMSNNSVTLEEDEDFEMLSEIAQRVIQNGEPGYLNLQNFKYGRIGKRDKVKPDKARGINPCAESLLEHAELCNQADTLPTMCQEPKIWLKACEYATLYTSTVSLLPTHRPETNRVIARNRRITIGIIDYSGWKHEASVSKVTKWMREGYSLIRKINSYYNAEAGVPEAIRVTTIKPNGTTSKLPGKTPGIGHPTFEYIIRRVIIAKNSPIIPLLVEANIPFEDSVTDKYSYVVEWPIHQGPALPADKISLWESAMNLVLVQREWADNAVSNTLYFRPRWVLQKTYDNLDDVKIYLGQSLDNQDDYISALVRLESDYEETIIDHPRLKITFLNSEYKIYQYDPNHEEHNIEPVLSAIAPLTKTVSLLPHTPNGVYQQMPEEGITKEEYLQRKAAIKSIDWSKLSDSDGSDERYCSGPQCEIPLKEIQ